MYNIPSYTGLDVSKTAVEKCSYKFSLDSSKKFFLLDNFLKNNLNNKYELSLSMDVIYHLIEEDVFNEYMKNIFNSSLKYIIFYSSNYDGYHCEHVKHREFTSWIQENITDWKLKEFIKNKYPYDIENPKETTFSDFYIYERIG